MKDILLTNIKDETGVSIEIGIAGEKIVAKTELAPNHSKVDGKGLTVIPGLIDLHTHLREPGREDAETVLTASQAAVLVALPQFRLCQIPILLQIQPESWNRSFPLARAMASAL